jgi:thiol-disulfide isomerase/thioredoxin
MKRKITMGLLLVLVLSVATFIINTYLKKSDALAKYQTLPEISFTTIYNQEQNTSNLPRYKGYVIQFFNPDCEICKGEAQDYFINRDSLKEYLLVMLSTDSISKVKDFALMQQLAQSDNFIFGHVEHETIDKAFGNIPFPTIYLYNQNRKYITKTRLTNSTLILRYFNKNTSNSNE